jgi:hypothetical protein
MKHIFITFATKNQDKINSWHKNIYYGGLRIQKQARDIGLFDDSILYTEEYLKNDLEFWDKHKVFIESNKKGYGYYIWKPYIIKKTMEQMNDGDILLYLDAGCEIDSTKSDIMTQLFEKTRKSKILGCGTGFNEIEWTKKDLFIKLNLYEKQYAMAQQFQSGTIFFLICDDTRKLVNEWYDLCCDYSNINDNNKSNYDYPDIDLGYHYRFNQHRHEQSVFSLLRQKYNIFENGNLNDSKVIYARRNRSGDSMFNNKK